MQEKPDRRTTLAAMGTVAALAAMDTPLIAAAIAKVAPSRGLPSVNKPMPRVRGAARRSCL